MMKFSIITVCFNSGKTIERTIKSVAGQKSDEFQIELIIVDGGSSDNTLDIIHESQRLGLVDESISEPDEGMYDAMNKGLGMASGDYLCILNSDDELEPNIAERCIAAANRRPPYFYGDNSVGLPDGTVVATKLQRFRIVSETLCCHQALWIRSDIIKKIGKYRTDIGHAADQDYMIRLFQTHPDGFYINKSLCIFHLGGQSGENDYLKSYMHVRRIHLDFLSKLAASTPEYGEAFLHGWACRIIAHLNEKTTDPCYSDFLTLSARRIGISSQSSIISRFLFRITFLLYNYTRRNKIYWFLYLGARALQLYSRNRIRHLSFNYSNKTSSSDFVI